MGRVIRDLSIMAALAALAFFALVATDAFEHFVRWSRWYEHWQLDELVMLGALLTLASAVFAWRRCVDLRREAARRDRSDAARQRSEIRLHGVLERLTDAVIRDDTSGRLVFANARFFEIFGFEPNQLTQLTLEDYVAPAHRESLRERHDRRVRGEAVPSHFEYEGLRRDGTRLWLEVDVVPLSDESGLRVGTQSILRDITERKRAEDARGRAAELLRIKGEMARIGAWELDVETLNVQWTDEMYRIHGLATGAGPSLAGTLDRYAPEARPTIAAVVESAIETGEPWDLELPTICAQGQTVWVRSIGRPERRGGRTVRIIGVIQDVTERRLADRDRSRLLDLLEQSVNEVYVFNAVTLLFEYVNAGARRNLGYSTDELHAMTPLDLKPDFDAAGFETVVAPLRRGEKDRLVFETVHRRSDGSLYPVRVHLQLALEEKHSAFFAVILDITEDRRASEERDDLESRLRQAQKMEAVGRLAGGVAHDFNNLLTVIKGYGEILRRKLPAENQSHEHVDRILGAASRAERLTHQLLAFSRKQVLQPEILDLGAVVAGATTLVRKLIGEDIDVVTQLAPSLGRVKADPGQVDQVVMNLAVNARDAMPRGGTLTLTTRDVELDEAYVRAHPGSRVGPYVLLGVTDTGCGMSPDVLSKVFEPFFTTKEAGKGTGLGLATVYGIVKQSDGYVDVESETGRGSTVSVYLPRVEAGSDAAVERAPPSPARPATETIVVAEDDELVRQLVVNVLSERGYSVLSGSTHEATMAAVAAHAGRIHLLVTDVVMPHVTGPEVANSIRSIQSDVRVLFMSGYTDDVIGRHGVLEPGVDFLQKPFTPAQFLAKVRESLDAPVAT